MSTPKFLIFSQLLGPDNSEPLLLQPIARLKACQLKELDLKVYYAFVTQLFKQCIEFAVLLDPPFASALFGFDLGYIFKKPIEGSACACQYVGLPQASPKGKELQYLINEFSKKLAESLEEKAPQTAYITFLAAIDHLDILNVVCFQADQHLPVPA